MCRYGFHTYKDHFACFECRKAFKRAPSWTYSPGAGEIERRFPQATCPDCGRPMADMGLDFAVPPRRDLDGWEAARRLFAGGVAFHSCGCGGPGYRPRRSRDVPAFLAREHRRAPGEALAERFAGRAGP